MLLKSYLMPNLDLNQLFTYISPIYWCSLSSLSTILVNFNKKIISMSGVFRSLPKLYSTSLIYSKQPLKISKHFIQPFSSYQRNTKAASCLLSSLCSDNYDFRLVSIVSLLSLIVLYHTPDQQEQYIWKIVRQGMSSRVMGRIMESCHFPHLQQLYLVRNTL